MKRRAASVLIAGAFDRRRCAGLRPVGPLSGSNPPRQQRARHGRTCEGFRTPAATNISPRTAAGVRKPPRDETAGRGTYWAVRRAQLWGFGCGRATAEIGSAVGSAGCDGVAAQMRRVFVISGPVRGGRSVWLWVVNAALERAPLWPAKERANGRTAFRRGGS